MDAKKNFEQQLTEFTERIEHLVRKDNVTDKIHDMALICRTWRLCKQYPELAEEYFNRQPKATMD